MGYANNDSGDWEKLQNAFRDITAKFSSLDALLEAFGLAHMPPAQRYGIMFGIGVFVCTVTAVVALLIWGGSFQRIAEQAQTGDATVLSAHDARAQRALLLEQLLESRERLRSKYQHEKASSAPTYLTKMLLNEELTEAAAVPPLAVDGDDNGANTTKTNGQKKYPPHYEANYVTAYRKCQDKPGGAILSGRPEARCEAYARAYAGCGPYLTAAYRRSYGRLYESICCRNHASDDKYLALFATRPQDIVGKYVRLEALQVERHLQNLFDVTSGEVQPDSKSFDPDEVWGFAPDGPFASCKDMKESYVFQHLPNTAAFAIINAVTDRLWGCIRLTQDDPANLTIQMEMPLLSPARMDTPEQLESMFMLLDRLFGYGYRRVQLGMDSQDADGRKLATRLGFTLEGILYKHMVVKQANRDSNIYAMLNSDWTRGAARGALLRKLYGKNVAMADAANEKKEAELDEQERGLAEKKRQEAEASKLNSLAQRK